MTRTIGNVLVLAGMILSIPGILLAIVGQWFQERA